MFKKIATITCLTLLCGACDDPSSRPYCADESAVPEDVEPGPAPDAETTGEPEDSEEPESCEPLADLDAEAFARVVRAQLQEDLDVTRIALFDEEDVLVADVTVTLDAASDDIHALAQFEYDDTQVEFMVVADVAAGQTEWELQLLAGEPEDARKVDLFVAKAQEHGLSWPGGEPVPTGDIACAGASIGAFGVCGSCVLCSGASAGTCVALCGAACIGATIGMLCACKDDAEHDC